MHKTVQNVNSAILNMLLLQFLIALLTFLPSNLIVIYEIPRCRTNNTANATNKGHTTAVRWHELLCI